MLQFLQKSISSRYVTVTLILSFSSYIPEKALTCKSTYHGYLERSTIDEKSFAATEQYETMVYGDLNVAGFAGSICL